MKLKHIYLLFCILSLLNCNKGSDTDEDIIIEEPTIEEPISSTLQVQDIHANSIKIIGELTSIGGYTILNHGFALGTNTEPTVNDISVSLGPNDVLGEFEHNFESLEPNTEYYIRTFLEYGNNIIKYGNTLSFSTLESNFWIEKTPILGGYLAGAVSFTLNDELFVGLGFHEFRTNTFKKYNYQSDSWSEVAPLPSNPRTGSISFGIGNYGYVGLGRYTTSSGFNYPNDIWRYNPNTHTWTSMANFPGEPRAFSTCFVIAEKAYVAGDELWEYDTNTNTWTQKADFPGVCSHRAVSFSINNKGYVGLGWNGGDSCNDFWEYDPATNSWTQKQSLPGNPRHSAISFSLMEKGYIGCGVNQAWGNSQYLTDFWKYEPASDSWIQLNTTFPGMGRNDMIAGVINDKIIMGLGANLISGPPDSRFDDIWEFILETN